jgi:hypothetical protein
MTFTSLIIILFPLIMIISGIVSLKKSANKFNLSEKQLKAIKERNKAFDEHDEADE